MPSENPMTPPPKNRGAQRRKSRDAFLDAGEDLLYELLDTPELNPLKLLGPAAVAERSGMSKGMLYNLWPVLPEDEDLDVSDRLARFRDDLAVRVYQHQFNSEAIATVALESFELGDDLTELVRKVSNAEIERVTSAAGSARLRAGILTELAAIGSETDLGRRLRECNVELLSANATIYQELLTAYGREMLPPLTIDQLAFMLATIGDGFGLASMNPSHPEFADEVEWSEAPGNWTLFAIAIDAVVQRVTRPTAAQHSDN